MREAFWDGLSGVRWEEAPLGPEAIRLVRRLRERGYAGRTCRDYGHAVVHLGRYLHEERESDRVRDEGVVADFLAGHLPGCRCYRRPAGRREEPARRGLAHLLVMLREEGAFPPVTADEPPYRQLTGGCCRFLRHDRGLAGTTVASYRRYLRDFLVSRGAAVSPAGLAALGADDLLAFSRQRGAGLGRTAWNHLATALPGSCRWLDMCGHGGAHLAGAVPSRRRCRLADVPCALSRVQVRRLPGVAGVREPDGRRNYAMLLLIASYAPARVRGQGAAAERHRLGARRDRHLRAEDRPAPRTAADPPGRGGGAGLPAGRTPPVAAPGSLRLQPPAAWPATEQDQPLAGTPAGQGGHRDRPPRCSYPAPLAGGPPAAQR